MTKEELIAWINLVNEHCDKLFKQWWESEVKRPLILIHDIVSLYDDGSNYIVKKIENRCESREIDHFVPNYEILAANEIVEKLEEKLTGLSNNEALINAEVLLVQKLRDIEPFISNSGFGRLALVQEIVLQKKPQFIYDYVIYAICNNKNEVK